MEVVQKLGVLTVSASLVIASLPCVHSSSSLKMLSSSIADPPNQKVKSLHKMSSKLEFEVSVHGFLLWASMGFLTPIGILAIRMSNRQGCGTKLKIMFYVHVISQVLSTVLATVAAAMSIRNFSNSFDNPHQRIGVVLYALIWLQSLIGLLRPQRGSKRRRAWFSVHWFLGTSMSLLGIITIYTGLVAFHRKTSGSIKVWTLLFSMEISAITFMYLFQDKSVYIKKQGAVMGNELVSPADLDTSSRQKDSLAEDC